MFSKKKPANNSAPIKATVNATKVKNDPELINSMDPGKVICPISFMNNDKIAAGLEIYGYPVNSFAELSKSIFENKDILPALDHSNLYRFGSINEGNLTFIYSNYIRHAILNNFCYKINNCSLNENKMLEYFNYKITLRSLLFKDGYLLHTERDAINSILSYYVSQTACLFSQIPDDKMIAKFNALKESSLIGILNYIYTLLIHVIDLETANIFSQIDFIPNINELNNKINISINKTGEKVNDPVVISAFVKQTISSEVINPLMDLLDQEINTLLSNIVLTYHSNYSMESQIRHELEDKKENDKSKPYKSIRDFNGCI